VGLLTPLRRRKLAAVLVRGRHCLSSISARAGEHPLAIQYAGEIVEPSPETERLYLSILRGEGDLSQPFRADTRLK
jgi:hypothetical protein